MRTFYINSDSLRCGTNFFINCSFEKMNEKLKNLGYPEVEEKWGHNTMGLYFIQDNDDKYFYGIWLPKFKRQNIEDIGILVHELNHVVDEQIKEKGFEGTEIKSYLLEFYTTEFLKLFK